MNGFRRAEVQVGSTVAVIGLGLIGQLAVRIARAAGCRVLGVDLSPELVELARAAGADAVVRSELEHGSRWDASADAVLVCAATESNDPALAAAQLARDRGRVVIVGDVGMDLPRAPFYDKELDLRLSRSYGPGRYDPNYELHGLDYPIGHVRWTEQRNMEAFLGLVADRKVIPSELVTHRFAFGDAERAFELLQSGTRVVGVVLRYGSNGATRTADSAEPPQAVRPRVRTGASKGASGPRLGLIGAGSFATGTLIPGLREAGFELAAIASASGLSAESARRQFGFDDAYSSVDELIDRDDLDLVAIATRHDSHAELAARALEAGRAVYVEKPLALDEAGLRRVIEAQRKSGAPLIVGFNRRFAPLAVELRELPGPRLMAYRVNAGPLPADHWTNDLARGGGRLKGEGCHFIDFLCDQAGSDPVTVSARGFVSRPDLPLAATDNFSVQIAFADGGVGTLHYAADCADRPGQGALRDQLARHLRGDRGLPERQDLARAPQGPPRRKPSGQGLLGPVRLARRDVARRGGAAVAPELLAVLAGHARGRPIASIGPVGAGPRPRERRSRSAGLVGPARGESDAWWSTLIEGCGGLTDGAT